MINPKKGLVFKNSTCYFDPSKDRVKVRVGSPLSYQSRKQKIEGYETRLYYQYKYCELVGGQTFYYTLTYNDSKVPSPYGFNCFDYEDLRDLLTGGFRKQLLRKYGTSFKYFIGAELGDGKGKRGMHNNPHYHILFFLEPSPFSYTRCVYEDVPDGVYSRGSSLHPKGSPKFKRVKRLETVEVPYKSISPTEFRTLVKLYWQGFDETLIGFQDYRLSKYGIAKEGDNCGLVSDFRACMYCAKYVCKDVKLKSSEEKVERLVRRKLLYGYKFTEQSYKEYLRQRLFELYNIPLNPKRTSWVYTEYQLCKRLIDDFPAFKRGYHLPNCISPYWMYVQRIIMDNNLYDDYCSFCRSKVESQVREALLEYRNRYCNKARISQGVGLYALEGIDRSNPLVQVPSKNGFKNRSIPLYFYRYLFYDKVVDKLGSNLYLLNKEGIEFKVKSLPERISKLSEMVSSYCAAVFSNPFIFDRMRESDVNTDVFCFYSDFKESFDLLSDSIGVSEIFKRYAEYKLVYEDRFFTYQFCGDSSRASFPPVNVFDDYRRFLVPSFYSVHRNDIALDLFLEDVPEDYLPYYSHPYFLRFLSLFACFDLFCDYLFVKDDDYKQKVAESIAEVKRFHSSQKLKEFYSRFS